VKGEKKSVAIFSYVDTAHELYRPLMSMPWLCQETR